MTKLAKTHLKRLRFVIIGITFFISITVVRSIYIQLLRPQDKSIVDVRPVKGPRGSILDRNGIQLAYDVNLYDLYVQKTDNVDIKRISRFMKKYFNANYNYDSLLSSSKGYLTLKKGIPDYKVDLLKSDLKLIEGLLISSKYTGRYYPRQELASQVIGKYSVNENERGLWGVEYSLNDLMKGKTGDLEFLTRSRGSNKPSYSMSDYQALSGDNVSLTIDVNYQRILEDELNSGLEKTNSESANGLIMDPYTGEILALASIPSLNLNGKINSNSQYRDNSTNYMYEPGSTLKIFPILAGLENNIIDLSDKYFCENGEYRINYLKRKIQDHDPYDTLSVSEILAQSSNIGIAKIADDVGKDNLYNILKRFGIGRKTGIKSYIEESGELKDVGDWDDWSLGSISMGQEMKATNIQVATIYSALANGGYIIEPKIIKDESPVSIVRKAAEIEDINEIISALKMVVSVGTAASDEDDFCLFGKTGTAQVWDADEGGYSSSTFIPSFVGVFPCEAPKLVCAISFYKPDSEYKWASLQAVPTVKGILRKILIKDNELAVEIENEAN